MEVYDYIVVGGGSSGCVVASRLSENPAKKVLLIEAGPASDAFWIQAPAGMGKLFLNRKFNWGYSTEPVESLGGRRVYWPRGKLLGGSSAINGMVYMRGHPRDFDHWANLGNPGWGWSDVLPYFLRSENNARGGSFHGSDGPMAVTDPVLRHPTTDDFVEAASRLGIARTNDLNAPPYEGVGYQQFTIRRGRRETSYDAFIAPVRNRRNLSIRVSTQVRRILFEGRRAVGVEVSENGEPPYAIRAAGEVILSGGTLNSPHLLMLSGIGDGAMLKRFDIDVLHHSPGVGRNLQDHYFGPLLLRSTPDSSYNRNLHGLRKYWEGLQYLLTRRGYLALGASPLSAYIRSEAGLVQPDLQLVLRPMTFNFHPSGEVIVDRFPGLSAAAVLLDPRSSGFVELQSADPLAAPRFQPNYLEHPDDGRRIVKGVRLLREILRTEPLASRVIEETQPGPGAVTDEQLIEHIKANGNCGWHQVGTCKMGRDDLSVLDERLRVRGIEGLRVIDASIMPKITSGNTNAPSIMIGEKGSDMVREDARAGTRAE